MQLMLFLATLESVLFYGCETWSVTTTLQKHLNGCNTRMLRMAPKIWWKHSRTNEELYDDVPPVALLVAERRLLVPWKSKRVNSVREEEHQLLISTEERHWGGRRIKDSDARHEGVEDACPMVASYRPKWGDSVSGNIYFTQDARIHTGVSRTWVWVFIARPSIGCWHWRFMIWKLQI